MKRMTKKMAALFLCLLMVFSLFGCAAEAEKDVAEEAVTEEAATEETGETAEKGKGRKLKIGVAVMDLTNEYQVHIIEGYEKFCELTGGQVEIVVVDGASDPQKQVEGLENFINAGVDGILIQSLNLDAVEDVVSRAEAAGIPVSIYPRLDDVATISQMMDEYTFGYGIGEVAGQWILDNMDGKATIACIDHATHAETHKRAVGYMEGVLSKCKEEDIVFLEAISTIEAMDAMKGIESKLQAHPETRVILSVADTPLMGAYQAVVTSGLPLDEFFMAGTDGNADVLEMLAAGDTPIKADGVPMYSVPETYFMYMDNLVRCLNGLDYDEVWQLPTTTLTTENVEEYMTREPVFELSAELQELYCN